MAQYSFYGGKQGRTYHLVEHYDSIYDMVLQFNKGGSYNDVNYNEYVIIDTFINNNEKSNRENGIIYRRGLNYSEVFNPNNMALNANHSLDDYDTKMVTLKGNTNVEYTDTTIPSSAANSKSVAVPAYRHYRYTFKNANTVEIIAGDLLTEIIDGKTVNTFNKAWEEFVKNPGGGAEYVGQIAGPISGAAEVSMLDWDEFNDEYPSYADGTKAEITAAVRPGVVETSTAAGEYYDNIQYGYFNITDAQDNIIGVTLAFDFPYTVFEVEAHSVSAYGPTVDSSKTEVQIKALTSAQAVRGTYYKSSDTNKYFIWDDDKVTLDESGYPVSYIKTPGMVETTIWSKTGTGPNYSYDGLVREKPDSKGHNFYKHYELSVPKGIHGQDSDISLDSNFYVTRTLKNYDNSAAGTTTTADLGHLKVLKKLEAEISPGVSSNIRASYFNTTNHNPVYDDELLPYPIVGSMLLTNGGSNPVENSNRLDQRKYISYTITSGSFNTITASSSYYNEVADVAVINNEVYALYTDPLIRQEGGSSSQITNEWVLHNFAKGTYGWQYDNDDTGSSTGSQFYYKRMGTTMGGKVYYKSYNSLSALQQAYPAGFPEPYTGQLAVVITQSGSIEVRTSYFYDYNNQAWTAISEEQSSDVYNGPFNVVVSDTANVSGTPTEGVQPQTGGIWLVEIGDE